VGGACRAEKEHVSIAISLVIVWAVVMVAALPPTARAIGMAPGPAGAWIGTSEFADAAGFAAAEQYNGPVLFENDAAAEVFAQVFAPKLTASRLPDSDDPRFEVFMKQLETALKKSRELHQTILGEKRDVGGEG
jgi:hypothetical protein